jgi:hypothetical protein
VDVILILRFFNFTLLTNHVFLTILLRISRKMLSKRDFYKHFVYGRDLGRKFLELYVQLQLYDFFFMLLKREAW